MRRIAFFLLACLALSVSVATAWQDDIDFNRARELRQRVARGERLSEDEETYLRRAIEARRAAAARSLEETLKPPVGLVPLSDMTADDRHKGEDGGLYGEGRNEPPGEHFKAALKQAELIKPLDAQGKPSCDGKVVLISVGMSNTTQEFSQFQRLAGDSRGLASNLVIVDGAQGGMDSRAWARPEAVARNRTEPWAFLEQRLKQAGVTAEQVQVAWLKQARINPSGIGEFPKHAEQLKSDMEVIVQMLKEKYPNLRIVYLSSRIYGGYARGLLNPEPYAYESAFAVRWLIQEQINGEKALNYDPERGEVKSPLLLWGPYLWADGEKGRKLDDLIYQRDDLAGDGTHPSTSGRRKVAEQLLEFFENDPTAKPWFLAAE
jgi:hypothetical protein